MFRRTISFLKGAGLVKTRALKYTVFNQRLIRLSKDNCTLTCCPGTSWRLNTFQRKIASDSRMEADIISENKTSISFVNLHDDDEDNVIDEAPLENITNKSKSRNNTIYLRGLPYSVTESEIVKFFSPLGISPIKVTLACGANGFFSGNAEVEFKSTTECTKALQKHQHYIGHRYIELSPTPFPHTNQYSSRQQYQGHRYIELSPTPFPHTNQYSSRQQYQGHRYIELSPTPFPHTNQYSSRQQYQGYQNNGDPFPIPYVVRLSGLPFNVKPNDISQFFKSLNITPSGIKLMHEPDGRLTGISLVAFKTENEANEALKNDGKYIGNRYVKINRLN